MNEHQQTNDYADKDIRIRPLVIFLGATLVVAALTVVFIYYLFNSYAARESQSAITAAERMMDLSRPTNAVVQGTGEAAIALAQQRAREDAALNHYAWRDAEAGVVQIPVARAMERMVEQGLFPVRNMTAAADEPAVDDAP